MTPVNPVKLGELLTSIGYDREKIDFLVEGFTHGFCIGHQGPTPKGYPKNHAKVAGKVAIVQYKIDKEVRAGWQAPSRIHPYLTLC